MLRTMTDILLALADARMSAAIEAVYRVFALPKPSVIEGCPCCIAKKGVDALLTNPLREITGDQLWTYVSGAFLTVGNDRDFRYLLPRILDISINDPVNANDPEIVLGKLKLADWQSWSVNEQAAIKALLDAWFEMALVRDLGGADDGWIGTETESVLCGASRAGLALETWLVRLHRPSAMRVLFDLKARYPGQLSPFWEFAPEGLEELSTILSQGQA